MVIQDATLFDPVTASEKDPARRALPSGRDAPIELSIIVPTKNEADNVVPLVTALAAALAGIRWEVVFVDDDSTDGTLERVQSMARRDRRVRCIHRIGRRGLTTACVEGILSSSASYVAVMDGDLQHDEMLLPRMLATLKTEPVDVVVGSRYVEGGGLGDWNAARVRISALAARLSRFVVKADLSDPMSGFFMLRRESFLAAVRRMSGQGFKILIDYFASSPTPLRFRELPFVFRTRRSGESKLDALVVWEYLALLADKLFGRVVPVRFLLFALVGGLGVGVHLAILWTAFHFVGLAFPPAQTTATIVAMAFNYVVNNLFTYRDRRLKGATFLWGFASFALVCSLGAAANVGVASFLFGTSRSWWLSGLAGAIVGSVFNYSMTSIFTWGRPGAGARA